MNGISEKSRRLQSLSIGNLPASPSISLTPSHNPHVPNMPSEKDYRPLKHQRFSSEDQESLLSSHEDIHSTYRTSQASRFRPSLFVIYSICTICCISLLANIASVVLLLHPKNLNLESSQTPHTSQHSSPISEAMQIKYVTTTWNGSFKHETIYRGRASPEVDAAWSDLVGGQPPFLAIPVSQAERYGLQPWQAKLDPATPGFENTKEPHLVANVELFHQLHCLDLLRMGSHWDYPYYEARDKQVAANGGVHGPFSTDSESSRRHFSHCLDMIRQRLMCSADVDVFGQVWVENSHSVTLMFSGERQCRNYDEIRSWVLENKIKENSRGKVELKYVPGDRIFANATDIP